LTKVDWLGRIVTVLGLVGLVLLALWTGAVRFAAGAPPEPPGPAGGPSADDGDGNGYDTDAGPDQDHPPDRREPAPALP
jgi:hypothetical protein